MGTGNVVHDPWNDLPIFYNQSHPSSTIYSFLSSKQLLFHNLSSLSSSAESVPACLSLLPLPVHTFFFFFFFKYIFCICFIYFRMCWVFVASRAFSSCGERASPVVGSRHAGLVALRHVGSSQTRAQTRVPLIGRRTPNHCATREAPKLKLFLLLTRRE